MAETVKELKKWLSSFSDEEMVAIDRGGLTLLIYSSEATDAERSKIDHDPQTANAYYEIGGVNI